MSFFFAIAIFLYALNIRPLVLNLHISDIIILVLFALFPIKIMQSSLNRAGIYRNTVAFYYLFIICLLFTGIFVNNIEKHMAGVIQYSYVYLILVPVILYFSKERFDLTLKAFIFGAILAGILALNYNFFEVKLLDSLIEYKLTGGAFKRVSVGATNDFGFILAISIVMIYILNVRGRLNTLYCYLLATFLLLVLIMTASRSSVLLLILFFSLIAIKHNIIKFIFISLIVIFVLFIAYSYIDILQNINRLSVDFNNIKGVSTDRFDQYSAALEILFSHFLGIGLSAYQSLMITEHPVHNVFLLIAVEGGWLAAIFFLFFWTVLLLEFLKEKRIGYIAFSISLSILIYIQTITHVYDRFLWVSIAIALALVSLNKKIKKRKCARI